MYQIVSVISVTEVHLQWCQIQTILPMGLVWFPPSLGVRVGAKEIHLSNGEQFMALNEPLTVLHYNNDHDYGGCRYDATQLVSGFFMDEYGRWRVPWSLGSWPHRKVGPLQTRIPSFSAEGEVCHIQITPRFRVGDLLHPPLVFRRTERWRHFAGPCMSCGFFAVPLQRPHGLGQWNRWLEAWVRAPWARKLVNVSPVRWPEFTSALEGHTFHGVIDVAEWEKEGFSPNQFLLERKKNSSSRKFPNTGCFHGHTGTTITFSVGDGVRLLWEFAGRNGRVFIVDSPEVSACYIFTDAEHARQWASGEIAWRTARERAARVIIHQRNWRERVSDCLRSLGVNGDNNPPPQVV